MGQINKAIFILSFDCEAKWGMADIISNDINKTITNKKLIDVYLKIVGLLDFYEIKATFAFVAAMIISESDYYHNHLNLFNNIKAHNNIWFDKFNEQVDNKEFDGWFVPELLNIVQSKKKHEVASHGFSHLPLSENLIERNEFFSEMEAVQIIMKEKHVLPTTLVFPRNLTGFISELKEFGFVGYRVSLFEDGNKYFSKFKNIVSEFNIFQKSQKPIHGNNIIEIPSGFFLNWRSGVRRLVPFFVSKARWKFIIKNSIKNDGIVHMWTHPHNFITGHKQFLLFEEIIKLVSKEVNNERMIVMTQHEYCNYIKENSLL